MQENDLNILHSAFLYKIIFTYSQIEKNQFKEYFNFVIGKSINGTTESNKLHFYLGMQRNYLEYLYRENDISITIKNSSGTKNDYIEKASLKTLLNIIQADYRSIFRHSLVIEKYDISIINTIRIFNEIRNKLAHESVNGFTKAASKLSDISYELIVKTLSSELDVDFSLYSIDKSDRSSKIYHSANVLAQMILINNYFKNKLYEKEE